MWGLGTIGVALTDTVGRWPVIGTGTEEGGGVSRLRCEVCPAMVVQAGRVQRVLCFWASGMERWRWVGEDEDARGDGGTGSYRWCCLRGFRCLLLLFAGI